MEIETNQEVELRRNMEVDGMFFLIDLLMYIAMDSGSDRESSKTEKRKADRGNSNSDLESADEGKEPTVSVHNDDKTTTTGILLYIYILIV
jgi:hypothetical protein